jgi:predicted component of type VI protein secretion system
VPPALDEPEREGGHTMIYSNAQRVREAVQRTSAARRAQATLAVAGRRVLLGPRGAILGRSRDCDVVLEDSSVSRQHAQLRPQGECDWTIEDLGSTNGVRVNGRVLRGVRVLRDGDRIELGSTEMLFEVVR